MILWGEVMIVAFVFMGGIIYPSVSIVLFLFCSPALSAL